MAEITLDHLAEQFDRLLTQSAAASEDMRRLTELLMRVNDRMEALLQECRTSRAMLKDLDRAL